jgi:hypothetical protein
MPRDPFSSIILSHIGGTRSILIDVEEFDLDQRGGKFNFYVVCRFGGFKIVLRCIFGGSASV